MTAVLINIMNTVDVVPAAAAVVVAVVMVNINEVIISRRQH